MADSYKTRAYAAMEKSFGKTCCCCCCCVALIKPNISTGVCGANTGILFADDMADTCCCCCCCCCCADDVMTVAVVCTGGGETARPVMSSS